MKQETKTETAKLQKHLNNLNLLSIYLLENSDYYFDMAKEDAENLFFDDKKEFNRLLKIALNESKRND